MILTNKTNAPPQYVRAAEDAIRYRPRKGLLRVTEMIDSPRIRQLTIKHYDDITLDVQDLIRGLVGSAWHEKIARYGGSNELTEETLRYELYGMTISGTLDNLEWLEIDKGKLIDHKTMNVSSAGFNKAEQYEKQMNCYAQLLRWNGFEVAELEMWVTYMGWQKGKSEQENYPTYELTGFRPRLWPPEEAIEYIETCVESHWMDDNGSESYCTSEERWERPTQWAVMKEGRKRALKVCDTYLAAFAWASDNGLTELYGDGEKLKGWEYSIAERPGASVRCESWCRVSPFCSQWKQIKEAENAGSN